MKRLVYSLLFIIIPIYAGSSDSDDERALPIAPATVTIPRLADAQDYPLEQITRRRSHSAPPSIHPSHQSNTSNHDIEALTIKERISHNRMNIAAIGLAATTVASVVSLTFYFADCNNK